MKTIHLRFKADTFYNGQLKYHAGVIYEVSTELGWAERWIKRGAEVVVIEEPKKIELPLELEQNKAVDEPKAKKETRSKRKAHLDL